MRARMDITLRGAWFLEVAPSSARHIASLDEGDLVAVALLSGPRKRIASKSFSSALGPSKSAIIAPGSVSASSMGARERSSTQSALATNVVRKKDCQRRTVRAARPVATRIARARSSAATTAQARRIALSRYTLRPRN